MRSATTRGSLRFAWLLRSVLHLLFLALSASTLWAGPQSVEAGAVESALGRLLNPFPEAWPTADKAAPVEPAVAEQMGSKILAVRRSPSGGWIFVSLTTRAPDRPAFSLDEMESVVTQAAFSSFMPRGFSVSRHNALISAGRDTPYVTVSFTATSSAYKVSGSPILAYRAALIPVVIRAGSVVVSGLVSIDARLAGSAQAEIATVENYLSQVTLDTEGAQTLRPEDLTVARLVAEYRPQPPNPPPAPAQSAIPPTQQTTAKALVKFLGSGGPEPALPFLNHDPRTAALLRLGRSDGAQALATKTLVESLEELSRLAEPDQERLRVIFVRAALESGEPAFLTLLASDQSFASRFHLADLSDSSFGEILRSALTASDETRQFMRSSEGARLLELSGRDLRRLAGYLPPMNSLGSQRPTKKSVIAPVVHEYVTDDEGLPACTRRSGDRIFPVRIKNLLDVGCGSR